MSARLAGFFLHAQLHERAGIRRHTANRRRSNRGELSRGSRAICRGPRRLANAAREGQRAARARDGPCGVAVCGLLECGALPALPTAGRRRQACRGSSSRELAPPFFLVGEVAPSGRARDAPLAGRSGRGRLQELADTGKSRARGCLTRGDQLFCAREIIPGEILHIG